jgi:hypothetical protein
MIKRWVGQVVVFKDKSVGVVREAQIMDIGGPINLQIECSNGTLSLYLTETELSLNRSTN